MACSSSSHIVSKTQDFTSSGTFVVPDNIFSLHVRAWGAGGAGGDQNPNTELGAGGGSGAYVEGDVSVQPGESVDVTVGSGGQPVSGASGLDGGTTQVQTMDSLLTATGGSGGNINGNGGTGGTASGGDVNLIGQNGGNALDQDAGMGGSAPLGGAGGFPSTSIVPTVPGGAGAGGVFGDVVVGGQAGANGLVILQWSDIVVVQSHVWHDYCC